jgi:alkylation response protein AidB-like acyl-CoA dehydrogenase
MESAKNWISQGLVADKAVIIATLIVNNKEYGIQGFLVNLRDNGVLLPGISMWDMGKKTVGNDLDNAMIMFKDFRVPKTALLNKYIDIMEDGNVYIRSNIRSFNIVGQQLFSGRVCVAQAALEFRNRLFENTRKYAESKLCWSKDGSQKLITIPHIQEIFKNNQTNYELCDRFVKMCENKLTKYLRSRQLPNEELINDIAIAKIKCVEDSIKHVNTLQNEIGSYALMYESGFGERDFLTCCKFAEGDTSYFNAKNCKRTNEKV